MGIVELIIAFCSGVITPLVPWYVKHRSEKKKENAIDVVNSHLEIQQKNQEVLDDIRAELDADRVAMIKFSNGTDFLDNTHMLNITMTGESNGNDSSAIKQNFSKIPAYLFDRSLNMLKSSDYFVENNIDVPDQKDQIINIRKSIGVETVVLVKVVDGKRGKWIGILLVGFSRTRIVTGDEIGILIIKSKQLH